jgi:hypothetical protein
MPRTQDLRRLRTLLDATRAARSPVKSFEPAPPAPNPLAVELARLKSQVDAIQAKLAQPPPPPPPVLKTVYRDPEGLIEYVVERPLAPEEEAAWVESPGTSTP